MAACKVLTLVLLAGTVCTAMPNRIIGGEPTTIELYPSIVQVESRGVISGTWSQSCGANVLNVLYVLSAAHCFDGQNYPGPDYRRIRAGTTDRNTGGAIVYVLQEINHPSYGQSGFDGDISVVRLTQPLVYSPSIAPATIIAQDSAIPDNSAVVHAGWGATSQGGSLSTVLQHVTIYKVSLEVCAQRYTGSAITDNMICAGILDVGGADACQGDSGGPLYYQGIVVGIVSWGRGCAQAYFPGVSTRVASYTNWIVETAV